MGHLKNLVGVEVGPGVHAVVAEFRILVDVESVGTFRQTGNGSRNL